MAGIKRNNGETRGCNWDVQIHNVGTNERLFMVWHYVTKLTNRPLELDPQVFTDLVNGKIQNTIRIGGFTRKEATFIQQNIGTIPLPSVNHHGLMVCGYDTVLNKPFSAMAYPKEGMEN